MNNLSIFIAHPDDEILFFGGILNQLNNSENNITICSFTCKEDPIRSLEFKNCLNSLKIDNFLLDYPVKRYTNLYISDNTIYKNIVKEKKYFFNANFLITHSPVGNERSHIQHIESFIYMNRIAKKNNIKLIYFENMKYSFLKYENIIDSGKNSKNKIYKVKINFVRYLFKIIYFYPKKITGIRSFFSFLFYFKNSYYNLFYYNYCLEVKIDKIKKLRQLDFYKSQKPFNLYSSANSNIEYLYFKNLNTLNNFINLLN